MIHFGLRIRIYLEVICVYKVYSNRYIAVKHNALLTNAMRINVIIYRFLFIYFICVLHMNMCVDTLNCVQWAMEYIRCPALYYSVYSLGRVSY